MSPRAVAFHKLVVLGGGGVGKTALVIQFVLGHFLAEYDPTIEDSYIKKAVVDNEVCTIDVLDTAGQEEYSAMREAYMKTGEAFILVYSVTSRNTFKQMQTFYQQIMRVKAAANQTTSKPALQAPIMYLVGNKADRSGEREVSTHEGFALARELGCSFSEVSAIKRHQVEQAFFDVVRLMRRQRDANGYCEIHNVRRAMEQLRQETNLVSPPKRRRSSMLSFSSWGRSSTPQQLSPRPILSVVQQKAIDELIVQAARKNDEKTVMQLLDMGAKPNSRSVMDGSALYASVAIGHRQMVKLLLKRGASVNAVGMADQSCLHAASLEGHSFLIDLLLDEGANIEAQSDMYGTPLLAAAARGQVDAVQTLLRRRPPANVRASGGIYGNALLAAAWIGNVKLTETLLQNGAYVHGRGKGGCTALQVASYLGNYDVVRLLLHWGGNVNDKGGLYGSPLRAANANSHYDVMRILLESGASEEDLAHGDDSTAGADRVRVSVEQQQPRDSHPTSTTTALPAQHRQHYSDGNEAESLTRNHSRQWLDRIAESDCSQEILLAYSSQSANGASADRVRVAVLDTGYDPDASFFIRPRLQRVQGWKDFTSTSAEPVDECGHGTHVVSLLMKVAPYADIYVARVAADDSELSSSGENIAKAILWAATEWRVDILSMSFGFDRETMYAGEPVISNAIHEAVHRRWGYILFFAAASNSGGNQREMFPACHPNVISMRGTSHLGTFEAYNPPPDPNGAVVFGTLGTEVPSAWLSTHGNLVYSSGTSVATPIAAGIAAMVLSCASLSCADRVASTPNPLRTLWSKSGMLSMFRNMSTPMEPRCFYLSPWAFIQKSNDERNALMIVATANA